MSASIQDSDAAARSETLTIASDDSGRIAQDLFCVACDYNMRGLLNDAGTICPECGGDLQGTIDAFVKHGDPRWLRTVIRGLDMGILSLITAILVAMPTGVALYNLRNPIWLIAALIVGMSIPVIMALIGTWLFSTPNIVMDTRFADTNTARIIARWAAVLLVVQFYVVVFLEILLHRIFPINLIVPFLIWAGLFTATVGVFAAGRYVSRLMRHLNHNNMAESVTVVSFVDGFIGVNLLFLLPIAFLSEFRVLMEALLLMNGIALLGFFPIMCLFTFMQMIAIRNLLCEKSGEPFLAAWRRRS